MFSGIQPTGGAHLGNYLGAIRRWVRMQDEAEAFICIVDLHAMTLKWDPAELRESSLAMGAMLLACGIDPARSVLFRQSQVPAHCELAWILQCVARMGELRRMVQFKEKSRGQTESVRVALFTYPVLQAADVLLYRAHGVPVGEDQRQHVELMRDIGGRFNAAFGDTFLLPEAWVPATGARIMSLDNPSEKMSKSSGRINSLIYLDDDRAAIARKIRSAVTDSGREVVASPDKPALSNLLTILAAIDGRPVAELEGEFREGGYAPFKTALADALSAHLEPIGARFRELLADRGELEATLRRGAERAAAVADATMEVVRERAGLPPPVR